jgi:hypothetical protein
MTIYAKLAAARQQFHQLPLKKSGLNKFAGYKYFELADFIVPGMDCLRDQGLVSYISFDNDFATMTLAEIETGDAIHICSPMSSAALKGCHEVQNLGAVQTYLRRYLWVTLLEIVEHDALDSSQPVEPNVTKLVTKAQAKKLADLIESLPADKATTVSGWIDAKFGGVDNLTAQAYQTVISKLEAA